MAGDLGHRPTIATVSKHLGRSYEHANPVSNGNGASNVAWRGRSDSFREELWALSTGHLTAMDVSRSVPRWMWGCWQPTHSESNADNRLPESVLCLCGRLGIYADDKRRQFRDIFHGSVERQQPHNDFRFKHGSASSHQCCGPRHCKYGHGHRIDTCSWWGHVRRGKLYNKSRGPSSDHLAVVSNRRGRPTTAISGYGNENPEHRGNPAGQQHHWR